MSEIYECVNCTEDMKSMSQADSEEPTIDWLIDQIVSQHSPLIDFNVKRLKALIAQQDRLSRIKTPCPACKHSSLIIGNGGWLVCGNLECSNPGAIDQLAHLQHEGGAK